MLHRLAQHYVGIKLKTENKYCILSDAKKQGHAVSFEVLYDAKKKRYSEIVEEIGCMEGAYIRQYRPPLNTQIPHEENWHEFDMNPNVAKSLAEILGN